MPVAKPAAECSGLLNTMACCLSFKKQTARYISNNYNHKQIF